MSIKDTIAEAAKEISDHLQVVDHIKALQQGQKLMADEIRASNERIARLEAEMTAFRAELKYETLKEVQTTVNAVQGGFNQRVQDIAERLAVFENELGNVQEDIAKSQKLLPPAEQGCCWQFYHLDCRWWVSVSDLGASGAKWFPSIISKVQQSNRRRDKACPSVHLCADSNHACFNNYHRAFHLVWSGIRMVRDKGTPICSGEDRWPSSLAVKPSDNRHNEPLAYAAVRHLDIRHQCAHGSADICRFALTSNSEQLQYQGQ